MAINDQLERIIASLDELVNSGEAKSEYGLSIEDRLLRIAEQLKKIKEEGGIGGKGFTIHICSATEYDAVTRIPTITDPDPSTIYLVPTSNASANLFDEYIFVDGAWELFGSSPAYVDITPTATVTKSGNIATITITDKNGTTTATISDGVNGVDGKDGKDGKDGTNGTNGTNGADGAPGVGVPTGGTTGQVLVKKTSTNYDTEWQTPSSGEVSDVKVNGTSILSNGIANIQTATDSRFGVVKTNQTYGIWSNNGVVQLVKPGINNIKAGTDQYAPVYVDSQHSSTFYGLAKAAGADMASSSNPVGTYTDAAKTAIRSMIGAVASNQGSANAGKVLGIGNDGSVSPVSAGGSSTLYGLQDTNFVQQDLIPGDALTYSYAADGTTTWSNVPLMYSCSLAESDFGGSSTYTYLLITNRHHQDGSDLEFYMEQGSRVIVYDPDTATPALFSIGFVVLNNGEMDERGNMLYEVWFIDVTQGHSPLAVRRFRKTYIEDAQDYYYIEVT